MTNTNMSTTPDDRAPFLLKPAGKDYLWGGSRLNDDFAKDIPLTPLAETWECSTHPDGPSLIASGPDTGKTLREVLQQHPDYLGTHPRAGAELPILIKLIDAKQDLSVQVHPDDAYAAAEENGQSGKNEMWYVLDAAQNARLVYGFAQDMDMDALRKSVEDGSVERYLQKVEIHKDDVFYIEAGTVHAIGAGALIAEIQQSSNLTYRLYDYNRVGKDGKLRELHLDKALAVADLSARTAPRQPMRVLKYKKGYATEALCRCQYFVVERMLLNTELCREMAALQTGANSFQVLLCVDGCGTMNWGQGTALNFFKGDCIFIPAESPLLRLHGRAQLLRVGC